MDSTRRDPTRAELLALDIDVRMHAVALQATACESWGAELAALLRAAYGQGYCDALLEPRRGALCRDHGFPIPASEK